MTLFKCKAFIKDNYCDNVLKFVHEHLLLSSKRMSYLLQLLVKIEANCSCLVE